MNKQLNFTDMEYSNRRRTTKREEFLKKMDQILPWMKWVDIVRPYYPTGKRGRPPREIEVMLRMLLLQLWFNLSDEAVEDVIYDSYAMKSFLSLDFDEAEQVPDATTLCKFRKLLNEHHLQKEIFDEVQRVLEKEGKQVKGGSIVDATIIEAPKSTKNANGEKDPEMHSVKKGTQWYSGMRIHIGADPLHGFVHTIWRKTRYRGIEKNLNYAYLAFASANLYMLSCFA